jgi:uncharacterized protein (UPF0548 family)
MLFLRRPAAATIRAFLASQARHDLTYSAVGATVTNAPAGYVVDHTHSKLGAGEEVFAAAQAALGRWQQFRLGWLEASPEDTPIKGGQVVAILARSIGLWWLNACRIVAVVDEDGPVKRFGFASGTLPDHAGSGEERFLVEWDREEGHVWYDIVAFSRPRHFLARLGYPWVRRVQKRFGRESAAAMCQSVGGGIETTRRVREAAGDESDRRGATKGAASAQDTASPDLLPVSPAMVDRHLTPGVFSKNL